MSIRRTTKKAFTLVEILIVVIILGILAAIVIPQFTNASQDARRSSMASQLQTLRSQVELYKLQHLDQLPDLVGKGWTLFTEKTAVDHTVGTDPLVHKFGPYMQAIPTNPINQLNTIVDSGGITPTVADAGFLYDYGAGTGSGKIWGVDKDDAGAAIIFKE